MRLAGAGTPVGLDFSAVLAIGGAIGADLTLLADVLPDVEPIIIDNLSGQEPDDVSE